jgi:hypothetical protein
MRNFVTFCIAKFFSKSYKLKVFQMMALTCAMHLLASIIDTQLVVWIISPGFAKFRIHPGYIFNGLTVMCSPMKTVPSCMFINRFFSLRMGPEQCCGSGQFCLDPDSDQKKFSQSFGWQFFAEIYCTKLNSVKRKITRI